MRTRVLIPVCSLLSLALTNACGGSAECGPGTEEQDGVCVPSAGGGGGADDLAGGDPAGDGMDGMDHDPADPGMGGDDPGGDMPGDPGAGGDDPADPGAGDPADPGNPADPGAGGGGGDPAAGCDAGGDCSELARQVLDAINAARAAAAEGACGGVAFAWDDGVAGVALAHANAQAAAGQMMVEDGSLGDRLDAAGLGYSAVGEVYGRAHGTPAEIVESWMGSEQLRPYLTSCEYTLGGIGAAAPAAGGSAFLTGTFLAP